MAGSCIFDTSQVKRSLHFSVLAVLAVQCQKDDICCAAYLQDVVSHAAVARINAAVFDRLYIGRLLRNGSSRVMVFTIKNLSRV